MKREIIRVEPLATYLEKYKAPTSTVAKHGDTLDLFHRTDGRHAGRRDSFSSGSPQRAPVPRQAAPRQANRKRCIVHHGS
jgi:hypothetical protein